MRSIPKRLMSCGMTTKLAEILKNSVSKNEAMLKNQLETLPKTYATSLFYTETLSKSDPEIFKGMFEKSTSVSLDRMQNTPKLSFSNLIESIRCELRRPADKDEKSK